MPRKRSSACEYKCRPLLQLLENTHARPTSSTGLLFISLPRAAEADFLRAGGVVIAYVDRSGCGSGFVRRELDLDGAAFRGPKRCGTVVGGDDEIVGG
jgi:hypothetical protein